MDKDTFDRLLAGIRGDEGVAPVVFVSVSRLPSLSVSYKHFGPEYPYHRYVEVTESQADEIEAAFVCTERGRSGRLNRVENEALSLSTWFIDGNPKSAWIPLPKRILDANAIFNIYTDRAAIQAAPPKPTRAERIAAGDLIDVTPAAWAGGFAWPTAVTRRVWEILNKPPKRTQKNPDTRTADLIFVAFLMTQQVKGVFRDGGIVFGAAIPFGRYTYMSFRIHASPDENGNPTLTIMAADESEA